VWKLEGSKKQYKRMCPKTSVRLTGQQRQAGGWQRPKSRIYPAPRLPPALRRVAWQTAACSGRLDNKRVCSCMFDVPRAFREWKPSSISSQQAGWKLEKRWNAASWLAQKTECLNILRRQLLGSYEEAGSCCRHVPHCSVEDGRIKKGMPCS
jgi:hypothetical protein